jgi:hypothetical protein
MRSAPATKARFPPPILGFDTTGTQVVSFTPQTFYPNSPPPPIPRETAPAQIGVWVEPRDGLNTVDKWINHHLPKSVRIF